MEIFDMIANQGLAVVLVVGLLFWGSKFITNLLKQMREDNLRNMEIIKNNTEALNNLSKKIEERM